MARIRTIKPDFFRHEQLYQAEVETGLPLRVAYAGLWTVADRRGRFRWRPNVLKLDVLPFDNVDFSRVLHALTTRGFLVRYASQGCEYGSIPSFESHQAINNRESESIIPSVDDEGSEILDFEPESSQNTTSAPRVPHACPTRHDLDIGEREGKGKGKGIYISTRRADFSDDLLPEETIPLSENPSLNQPPQSVKPVRRYDDEWKAFRFAYPKRSGALDLKKGEEKFMALCRSGTDPTAIIDGAHRYAAWCDAVGRSGTEFVRQVPTWLNNCGWSEDYAIPPNGKPAKAGEPSLTDVRRQLGEMLGCPVDDHGSSSSEDTEPVIDAEFNEVLT